MSIKRLFAALLILLITGCLSAQEEFNGPMPGWANVKTRFGAKGNGTADDTRAIQQALDSLTQPVVNFNTEKNSYMVIYLPAGVYNISAALLLKGKIGVSIIGESPLTTIIKWKGADASTMLLANGTAYFKISRLTWDANMHKDIEAIGIHWRTREKDAKSESAAPTGIEIADNVFTGNCKYGIGGGTGVGQGMNAMDSEIAIRRCLFQQCETGIQITGYNALDYWIWDCQFNKCSFGLKCTSGNYHVYRSNFRDCYSDVENTNSYYTSLRGCYSENSSHFSYDQGSSSNPFKRIFQNNTVVAPKLIPVISYHLGKITLLDNRFDSAAGKSVKSFVEFGGWANGNYQVLSINNKYRNVKPVQFNKPSSTFFSFGDSRGENIQKKDASLMSVQEKMPLTVKRPIFSVPSGASGKSIQEIITKAAKLTGSRPIIYLPVGIYRLDEPLIIPENTDLQLVGDGFLYATRLFPSSVFPKGKALLQVKGPTSIAIRDLQLGDFSGGNNNTNGIQFTNTDQPGSQAFIEQLYTNSQRSIFSDRLDYLYIQETNSFFSYGKTIVGGAMVQNGKGTAGLYCFGSQFAGLTTSNNAVAVIKDCWWEGATRKPLNFSGSGRITIDGAMVAPNDADSNTTIAINKFSGKISLLNMYVQGGISVEKNNPSLNFLLWNIHFYHALNPLKFNTGDANFKGAFIGLTTQCFTPGNPNCADIITVKDETKGSMKMDNFFPEMLADDRAAMPRKYNAVKKGVSSIYISRVSAGDCGTSITFTK